MNRVDFSSSNTVWVLVFLSLLTFRIYLISETPAVYSWDAFTRLWEDRTLLVRHWLPIPQLPIFLAGFFEINLFFLRFIYALAAVTGAVFLGLFIARDWGEQIGLTTAILASLLPSYTMFSIVPYQECFLVLFLGMFLYYWDHALKEPDKYLLYISSFSIILAELSRYEAWIFVVIAFSGIVFRQQWRLFPALIPAIIVPLVWLYILNNFDFADGPPRTEQSFMELTNKTDALTSISKYYFYAMKSVFFYINSEFALIGLPFILWGLVISWKNGGLSGRELLVFLLILFLLSTFRAANSGVHTIRMQTLFNFLSVIYLIIGLHSISNTLIKKTSNLFFISISTVMILNFATRGYTFSKANSLSFLPEAEASSLLTSFQEKQPDDIKVMIVPRKISNILDESAIGAIFANSTTLDHRDSRWLFPGKPDTKQNIEPTYILSYDSEDKKYILSRPFR